MIGWLGLCAKIVDFIISKAADRTITWSLDARRKAARALIRFYETLEESSLLLQNLIEVFNNALKRKKPIFFSKDLVPFENDITRLTEDVARQYDELVAAIDLFDPKLARLLHRVRGLKVFALTAFGRLLQNARFQQEAVVTTVTAPGDVLLATHKDLEERTKRGLARATARAAEAAAKSEEPLPVSNTAHLRDLAQSAARIFGWNTDGPQVQLNQQVVISQEQLEQIRQLRGVPEPEQLQERKNHEL